ncbi:MAG TPA: GAF domain-containing protein [Azospirillaceae bacterium]|nr:GAF domain-containing protein [Azospirillaceae bacterium]
MAERATGGEAERLAALHDCRILDTPDEPAFDRLTDWARGFFDVPIALVSLVDHDRLWCKSAAGLDVRELPRDITFCHHTVAQGAPLILEDMADDPRFRDHPLVKGEPHFRFYAGVPLTSEAGHSLGSFCLLGHEPRNFNAAQLKLLSSLAEMASATIRLRLAALNAAGGAVELP